MCTIPCGACSTRTLYKSYGEINSRHIYAWLLGKMLLAWKLATCTWLFLKQTVILVSIVKLHHKELLYIWNQPLCSLVILRVIWRLLLAPCHCVHHLSSYRRISGAACTRNNPHLHLSLLLPAAAREEGVLSPEHLMWVTEGHLSVIESWDLGATRLLLSATEILSLWVWVGGYLGCRLVVAINRQWIQCICTVTLLSSVWPEYCLLTTLQHCNIVYSLHCSWSICGIISITFTSSLMSRPFPRITWTSGYIRILAPSWFAIIYGSAWGTQGFRGAIYENTSTWLLPWWLCTYNTMIHIFRLP